MNTLVAKFTSRKFLLSLAAVILAVVLAGMGVITWEQALAAIQLAVAFYVGAEAGIDLMGVFKDLLGALWQKKLQAAVESRVKELLADFLSEKPAASSAAPASPAPPTGG